MRCPSTSDLVHAQANHAYDKLAVISDNIEALQAIYDFIFDIKEYLHQRLKEYMHKHRDELIDGQKTFTKPVRLEELELFSSVNADIEDTVGRIKLNFTTCSPYISFKVSRIDDETKEEYVSEVKLMLDTCNGEPLLTIPPTNGDVPESAVRVDFLNAQLTAIGVRTTELESNTSDLPSLNNRISSIETKMNNILDYPVDGSSDLVTSDGIHDYGQSILNTITNSINNIQDTTYSFSLSDSNLIITPSSGNTQILDLSSVVSGGNSSNNDSPGSVETEGTYAGYRIWRSGNLAVVFVPGGDNLYNQAAISKPLPFAMEPIAISSHVMGSSYIGAGNVTGTYQGNGSYTIHLIENGTKLEVIYSGGGNSPGTGEFPETTIIGWVI